MQDQEVVAKFQQGDRSAFNELLNRYQTPVAKTCFRFLGNREDAEDAAQEIFVKVYKALDGFRPEAKFSTWLYRIAVNHCLNAQRSQKRRSLFSSINPFRATEVEVRASTLNPATRPDVAHETRERAAIVKKAIEALPDGQRAAIILHRYEGFSYKEIAQIMNTSISSVESRLHRAKTNLYRQLKPFFKNEKY